MTSIVEKPQSSFDRPGIDKTSFVGGVVFALLVHVGVPVALVGFAGGAGLFGEDVVRRAQVDERHIVAAKFVKLGRQFDPRQLPNREVPRLSTAPPDGVAVSKNENPVVRDRPDAAVPPPNATLDALLRIGDRAQQFAEIAPERPVEGDPNGIEEGTENRASQAGDLYAGQLYRFFHRGWSVPTTIPEAEAARLVVDIDVEITNDLHLGEVRVRRSSGSELFDQSALDRINALKASNATVPEPPAEIASQYVGQTMGVQFNGRRR